MHWERTEAVGTVGGDLLHDASEGRRVSSAVVQQFNKMSEVILLGFEHIVAD